MFRLGKIQPIIPKEGEIRPLLSQYNAKVWGGALAVNLGLLWAIASITVYFVPLSDFKEEGAIAIQVISAEEFFEEEPTPEREEVEIEAEAVTLEEVEVEDAENAKEVEAPPPPEPSQTVEIETIQEEPKPQQIPDLSILKPRAPIQEEEIDYSNLTGPEIDALYKQKLRAPTVALPEVGEEGRSGIVAIYCFEEFEDADKAAECAGRPEIRSGWVKTDEDWTGIVQSLRRGGVDIPDDPSYGPNWRAPLANNETYYQEEDLRFTLGVKEARKLYLEERYNELKAASVGSEQTVNPLGQSLDNLGGEVPCYVADCNWQPSWTLREDPYVDEKLADEIRAYARERAGDD